MNMKPILIVALFAPFAFAAPVHAGSAAPATERAAMQPRPADPRSFSAYGDGAPLPGAREERPAPGWRPEGAEWPQLP
jgi:hypothetical protein